MNYDLMLRQHKDSGADVTMATILIDPTETKHFGVVEIDRDGRVVGFQEKPEQTGLALAVQPAHGFGLDGHLPVQYRRTDSGVAEGRRRSQFRHDFGHNILPRMVDDYKVYSFNFIDENRKEALYWRDVGTLEAYYEANMDLVSVAPVFNLYDIAGRSVLTCGNIRRPSSCSTIPAAPAGARFDRLHGLHHLRRFGQQQRSVARRPGEFLLRGRYQHFVLARNVGRHCSIRKAIIDRDVHIPEGTVIGFDIEADRQKYHVTESGITVVTRDYSLFENPITVDYFTSE